MVALRISEVAAQTGFSPSTLRYYEDVGLLPELPRSDTGYRLFDERSMRRLALIARAKQLGLSLEEINELAGIWDGDECAPVQARLIALVGDKVREARQRIDHLEAFASELERAVDDLGRRTTTGSCDDDCGCTSPTIGEAPPPVPVGMGRAPAPDPTQPIACTLQSTAIIGRLEEWRDTLGESTIASRLDDGVRFEFAADMDVAALAVLATAEQHCCSFLTFGLLIDRDSVTLEIRGTADAAPVLDTFLDLAR